MYEINTPPPTPELSKSHLVRWMGSAFKVKTGGYENNPEGLLEEVIAIEKVGEIPDGLEDAAIVYDRFHIRSSVVNLKPSKKLYSIGMDCGDGGSILIADIDLPGASALHLCVFFIDTDKRERGRSAGNIIQDWFSVCENPSILIGGYKDITVVALQLMSVKS